MRLYTERERMLQGPVAPAEEQPSPEITRRIADARDEAYWQVMQGEPCAFWPENEWRTTLDSPLWDDEQQLRLFVAIQTACRLVGASDIDRWCVVEQALRAEAERYADYCADKVI
jgi:hypothetical protein